MKTNTINFEEINSFDMLIKYVDIYPDSPLNEYNNHIHNKCEIYINLSGDVSFFVENHIYPVTSGNVVITRPNEYHHCIYHSDKLHKHYWILFNSQNNEELFDIFFKRELGKNNLLVLNYKQKDLIVEICEKLLDVQEKKHTLEKYCYFFELISLLNNAETVSNPMKIADSCLVKAINYINNNITENLQIKKIAESCYVSVNTLERKFVQNFDILPSAYIKKKRLAIASKLLSEGCSVSEAAEKSGFCDCSRFISAFKKNYGTTPLKYQKSKKQ